MQKKFSLFSLCVVLTIVLLCGCGTKNNNNIPTPKSGNSEEKADKQENNIGKNNEDADVKQEKQTNKSDKPFLADRLDAWDDFYNEYGSYYASVQIEDMFFYPGMMGSELFDIISESKDKNIISVSASKLIEPDNTVYLESTQNIEIYRNETLWFTVYVRNYTDDLLSLSECIVSLVQPSTDALAYSRFFDGNYTLDSMYKINYQDYAAIEEAFLKMGHILSKKGSKWSIRTGGYSPASLTDTLLYWTKQNLIVNLNINADTGMVDKFEIDTSNINDSVCELWVQKVTEDFDWSDDKYAEQLEKLYEQKSEGNTKNIDVVGVYINRYYGGYNFDIIVRWMDSDSKMQYSKMRMNYLYIDYLGNIAESCEFGKIYRTDPSYMAFLKYSSIIDEDIVHIYDKDVITEYKKVTSFKDITAEQLNIIIERAFEESADIHKKRKNETVVSQNLKYISIGNDQAAGDDIIRNAIWLVVETQLEDKLTYTFVDFYDPYLDVEAKFIEKAIITNGYQYDDYYTGLSECQLDDMSVNNQWITELIPQSLAQELSDLYGYQIDPDCIAK